MKMITTFFVCCLAIFVAPAAKADNQTLLAEIQEAMQPGFLYQANPPEFAGEPAEVELMRLHADNLMTLSFFVGTITEGSQTGTTFCVFTEERTFNNSFTHYRDVNCDGRVEQVANLGEDATFILLPEQEAVEAYTALLPRVMDMTRLNTLLRYAISNLNPHWGWGALPSRERRSYTWEIIRTLAERYGDEEDARLGQFFFFGPVAEHVHFVAHSIQSDGARLCVASVYDVDNRTKYTAYDLHCDDRRLLEREALVDVGARSQTTFSRANERYGENINRSAFDKAYAVLHFLAMHYPEVFD